MTLFNPSIPNQTDHLTVDTISMEAYYDLWRHEKTTLQWTCLFVLPFWLDEVCRYLGAPGDPTIIVVRDRTGVIGVAPLAVSDRRAFFLGNPNVCDYQDIVSASGKSGWVMQAVIHHLAYLGVEHLDLGTLRPDAAVLAGWNAMNAQQKMHAQIITDNVTYEAELPGSWDGFLHQLNSKQRHEVRRKIRRLEAESTPTFRMAPCDESLEASIETFIQLFQMNRADKADFMDLPMADYFKGLIHSLARQQMLRLFFLDLDGQPAATALCFDYGRVRYLYNSGYDAQFQSLSAGILCKVFSIKQAIETGCRHYDFLKGAEIYKKRIGGNETALCRYQLSLTPPQGIP